MGVEPRVGPRLLKCVTRSSSRCGVPKGSAAPTVMTTRLWPSGPRKERCWASMLPEPSTAIPTPRPFNEPPPTGKVRKTAPLPTVVSNRLAWCAVLRLGTILRTSERAARAGRLPAGTMADTARTDKRGSSRQQF